MHTHCTGHALVAYTILAILMIVKTQNKEKGSGFKSSLGDMALIVRVPYSSKAYYSGHLYRGYTKKLASARERAMLAL